MRTLVMTGMLVAWVLATDGFAADTAARFQTLEQYTRIQIPTAAGSSFRLVQGQGSETTLVLDRVDIAGLQASAGWGDGRVKAVTVKPLGLDRAEVTVRFARAGTEAFAYLQGGNIVLDLWHQAPASVAAAPVAAPVPAKSVNTRVAKKPGTTARRKLASAEPVKATVSVAPLSRDKDIFQKFVLPMPELRLEGKGLRSLPPRAELEDLWAFPEADTKTEEGAAFKLARKLFEDKKYGLAVKASEIAQKQFADGELGPYFRYLDALSYRRLGEATKNAGLVERAEKKLNELAAQRDAKGEPYPYHRAIRTYFGQREYLRGNWLPAISHLEYVASFLPPGEEDFAYVQILLAECYAKVNEPRRAERVFRFLAEKMPRHVLAKEAKYRIADLLGTERNYKRVIEDGAEARRAYPEYEKTRSEVLFHMGEASFWLGNYADADRLLRRFTEISSAQTNSALAWVRIGEIAEVFRGDIAGAREAYLKAKNGYPFSPGDLVATVRLARIDLPNEKEPGFVVKRLEEMLSDKTTDADLRRMAEITLGDYLLLSGQVENSLELARKGMGSTEGAAYEAYKGVYVRGLFGKLQRFNAEGKFSEALALYDRERKWFDQHGAESFRAVAETYRGLGLYATSSELMEKYLRELKQGRALASGSAKQELSLARAKNSFARGAYAELLKELPKEGGAEILAMKAIAESRLGRATDAYRSARAALAASDRAELDDDTLLELAEAQIEWNNTQRDFSRMESDLALVRPLLKKEHERFEYAAADALWYQKKHAEAVATYTKALEKFPKGERAERAQYNLGMSSLSLGKKADAVKWLTGLRDGGQSLWAESAKQELQLLDWEKKYSSVLRTLPPAGLGIDR